MMPEVYEAYGEAMSGIIEVDALAKAGKASRTHCMILQPEGVSGFCTVDG